MADNVKITPIKLNLTLASGLGINRGTTWNFSTQMVTGKIEYIRDIRKDLVPFYSSCEILVPRPSIPVGMGGACCNNDFVIKDEQPVDLTGFTGECEIRTSAGAAQIIAQPTVTITDASKGIFKLSLTAAQTSAIPAPGETYYESSMYQYDLVFTKNNETYRAFEGFVEVSPNVTIVG